MAILAKQWLRDVAIYFLKALAFSAGSYLLIFVIYGGARISFLAWLAVVILAFAIAYVPYVIRGIKGQAKRDGN